MLIVCVAFLIEEAKSANPVFFLSSIRRHTVFSGVTGFSALSFPVVFSGFYTLDFFFFFSFTISYTS